jgi:ABC-type multidrug transport system fused ATPase/permease subunit
MARTTLKRAPPARNMNVLSSKRTFGATWRFLTRSEKRQAAIVLASALLNSLLGLSSILGVVPFFRLLIEPDPLDPGSFVGGLLRGLGIETELSAVLLMGLAVVGIIAVKNGYGIAHQRLVNRFCARIEARAATRVLTYVVTAPFAWYVQQNTSLLRDIVMSDVVEWSRAFVRPTLNLANDMFLLLLAVGTLVVVTPVAGAIVTIGGGAVALALLAVASPRVMLATRRKRQHSIVAGVAASEAINGGRDVRTSNAGTVLIDEFSRHFSIYSYSDGDVRQWQFIPRSGIEVVGLSALIGVAIGAILVGMERMQIATVLAVYALIAVRLIPLLGEVARGVASVRESMHRSQHLMTMFERIRTAPYTPPGVVEFADWRQLNLRKVAFQYEGAELLAVSEIDLTIERGRSYGLVGSSGAGKSTLADLIAGLIQPTGGELAVDGIAITPKGLSSWRLDVAYVSQHPILFDTSLADNISLGDRSSDAEVRLAFAISQAGLGGVIEGLPQGVETILGDRGVLLSGGQRQRVAIARALYQRAGVLILDEATSALDSLTEAEITDAIRRLRGQMTVIVIAHRLSTVTHCDEIILLNRGQITARGSHEELLSRSADYFAFVSAQSVIH